ncbi:MAG TPA: hypothetical protein DCP92_11175 [Nitrospiraceae bacterium]|nr:hypothetical protein [Nitrospiraceae bacterium]
MGNGIRIAVMVVFWSVIIMGIIYLIKSVAFGVKKKSLKEWPFDILKKIMRKTNLAGKNDLKMD